jgi:hypothetical protein
MIATPAWLTRSYAIGAVDIVPTRTTGARGACPRSRTVVLLYLLAYATWLNPAEMLAPHSRHKVAHREPFRGESSHRRPTNVLRTLRPTSAADPLDHRFVPPRNRTAEYLVSSSVRLRLVRVITYADLGTIAEVSVLAVSTVVCSTSLRRLWCTAGALIARRSGRGRDLLPFSFL